MREKVIHPGFSDYSDTSGIKAAREQLRFNDFLPFIVTDGLDPNIETTFREFISRLFVQTGQEWEPGSCQNTDRRLAVAQQIVSHLLPKTFSGVYPKRFQRAHFWLQLETEDRSIQS